MKKQNLRILLSGFCLSSLIALVAFLFLMAEKIWQPSIVGKLGAFCALSQPL